MLRTTRLDSSLGLALPSGPIYRLHMVRTVLGRPVHSVSAYLADGLLIDSGPPVLAARLVDWLQGHSEDGPALERVLLTHHHEDHSGGAAPIRDALGVPILAPALAVPILAEGLRMPFYRRLVWGRRPETFVAEPLPEVVESEHLRLRVLPTPGHAFTHVCLFDEERRWLFSGDLFVHERVKFLRRIEDLPTHLDSLRRIAALEPEVMLCAHAGPVAEPTDALRRKIRYWEKLAEEARQLAALGWSEARITRHLLGRETFLTFFSFGDFSKRNLVRAVLAMGESGPIRRGFKRSSDRGLLQ